MRDADLGDADLAPRLGADLGHPQFSSIQNHRRHPDLLGPPRIPKARTAPKNAGLRVLIPLFGFKRRFEGNAIIGGRRIRRKKKKKERGQVLNLEFALLEG